MEDRRRNGPELCHKVAGLLLILDTFVANRPCFLAL